jgi:hypothetical protein
LHPESSSRKESERTFASLLKASAEDYTGAIANFLWYLHAMDLSRRHFFRRLWSTGDKRRKNGWRYTVLESFARTQLLPYDFSLTDEQLSAMQEGVRFHSKSDSRQGTVRS